VSDAVITKARNTIRTDNINRAKEEVTKKEQIERTYNKAEITANKATIIAVYPKDAQEILAYLEMLSSVSTATINGENAATKAPVTRSAST